METKPDIIAIMGPTASGKSELAFKFAIENGAEIISADSMQVYRGLNIGTAKPFEEERRKVPHHMLDILDISEPLDVYKYVEAAENCIADIKSRGRIAVICGGTGFYIRSLLCGLDPLPGDPNLRKELDALYDNDEGFEELKRLMTEKDPAAFSRWNSHRRKLIRALEVLTITGKSIMELQTLSPEKPLLPVRQIILSWEREELKKRIAVRTEKMLDSGWIDEAGTMIKKGLFDTPTAHQALGYKEIAEFLDGKISRQKLAEKIATSTWQYARRQITWFKTKHPGSETVNMPCSYEDLNL